MLTEDESDVIEALWKVKPNASFIQMYQSPDNWVTKISQDPRMEELEKEIDAFYDENIETKEEFSEKESFREALEGLIAEHNKSGQMNWNCRVFPTGSTISGLATRNSDVDLCLYIPGAHEIGDARNREACLRILQMVRHMLHYALQNDTFPYPIATIDIVDAQIQLLKIVLSNGLEIDLSVCTDRFLSGCHNSYLIRGYCEVDDRFAPLCIFIKRWATNTRFKDPLPHQGRFNSYAVVMLVIHFLQSGVNPPVLPNLQKLFPEGYAQTPEDFPDIIHFGKTPVPECAGQNKMSKAELFLRFLVYYKDFDFDKHCVSLRDSAVTFRANEKNDPQKNRVYIHDPIDQHNPGRTVKDVDGVKNILTTTLRLFEDSQVDGNKSPSVEDLISVHVDNLFGV